MRTFNSKEAALQFLMTEVPWGCSAGVCRDVALAKSYAEVGMTMIVHGSSTKDSRAGNPGDNFYYDDSTGNSENALGIPNRGIDAYVPELAAAKPEINKLGAKLWASVSAGNSFIADEYEYMARIIWASNAADVIEGNFSCPNIEVGGKRKPVVCFDLADFRAGVQALRSGAGDIPTAAKIAPHTEARWLGDIIEICLEERVSYLIMGNTLGNCYIEESMGVPAISMVRGGAAGRILHPIVCGMLHIAAPLVKGTELKIIATGGIEEGADAYRCLRLGAHGFGFNTILSRDGGEPDSVPDLIFGNEGRHVPGLVDLLYEYGLPN